jgi:hypothetical protein
MTHVKPDFKTKWDLKDAVQRGEKVLIESSSSDDNRAMRQVHSCDYGWHAMAEVRLVNGEMRVVKVL